MRSLAKGCGLLAAVLLLSAGAVARGAAASPWSLRVWKVADGLPNNNVTGIAQTPDGYLWVATRGGLARFDGVRFQSVPVAARYESHFMARVILLARDNSLWVASDWGQPVIAQCATRTPALYTAADGLPGSKPLSLAQTPDGAVWVGYQDGSVCRLLTNRVTRFVAGEAGLPAGEKTRLATDESGRLWFATAGTIGVWTGERFEARFKLTDATPRLTAARGGGMWILSGRQLLKADAESGPVRVAELPTTRRGVAAMAVYEDRVGGVWLGTEVGGLFHWDGKSVVPVATSHGDIESILEDREGNIWVGSRGGGLNRLHPRVLEVHDDSTGLPFDAGLSIGETTDGELWAVGANGVLARGQGDQWREVGVEDGWTGSRVSCVTGDGQGGVWIGTAGQGLFHGRAGKFSVLRREDGLGGENITALLVDSRTNLWLGMESPNCLQRFSDGKFHTLEQPAGTQTIRAMAEDRPGNLWLGTLDGSLLRVTADGLVNETARALQPTRPIRALHVTADGSLWIGYAGGGVGRWRDGRFAQIGTAQGLLDDTICGLASDAHGNMWFTSERGLFQVSLRELDDLWAGKVGRVAAVDCSANDGLPDLQGNYGRWPNALRARDGRCWFATRSGLVAAIPGPVQLDLPAPVAVVERLTVDGQVWELDQNGATLRLPPGVRRLDIEFTALSFAAPESLVFQTRLQGRDEPWSSADALRRVNYFRLAPGAYEFQVRARNSAGVWSAQESVVRFVIAPFFWQTWWFRALVALGFTALLIGVVRAYERARARRKLAQLERERAVERERARIARDIHDEIGTGLTQISLLADVGGAPTGDLREVETSMARIGERARSVVRSLDEIVWAANPRNDFLPRLADYLCHLLEDSCETAAGVRARKELPVSLPALPVRAEVRHNLALAVKEAITNSLKHSRADTLWLRLHWREPELTVTVEDNGIGFDAAQTRPLGNGLANQRARLQEIGGSVELHTAPGRGTRSVFRVVITTGG